MLIKALIKDTIPPLKFSDTVGKAIAWMEDFHVAHLPVVDEKGYVGLLSLPSLSTLDQAQQVSALNESLFDKSFINDNRHVYEVMKLMYDKEISVVPVMSDDNKYLGIITLADVVQYFSGTGAVQDPGGIIVLEVNANDYVMSQIAQIVESDNASVLSSFISNLPENKIEITLKLNKPDLSRVIAAFERYNYTVKESYHQSDFVDTLKSRYDSLMNYLNI
ncbi:MAG TPA: CBS domain-containing protein [Bacteroidia bacterium]|nr:CBS domain-containing protein [Bacteroidia bacterium]